MSTLTPSHTQKVISGVGLKTEEYNQLTVKWEPASSITRSNSWVVSGGVQSVFMQLDKPSWGPVDQLLVDQSSKDYAVSIKDTIDRLVGADSTVVVSMHSQFNLFTKESFFQSKELKFNFANEDDKRVVTLIFKCHIVDPKTGESGHKALPFALHTPTKPKAQLRTKIKLLSGKYKEMVVKPSEGRDLLPNKTWENPENLDLRVYKQTFFSVFLRD